MKRRSGAAFRRRPVVAALVVAALCAVAAGFGAGRIAQSAAIDAIADEASVELAFVADALERDLSRYKLLAKSLSESAQFRRRALADFPAGDAEAEAQLERMAAISGAVAARFRTRATVARGPERAAVAAAYHGAMGLAFDPVGGGAFLVAAPVWSDARVIGAIVVEVEAAALEWAWRATPRTIFFTGDRGRIRLASLPALRLRTTHGAADPLPTLTAESRRGAVFWRLLSPEWRRLGVDAREVLVATRAAPAVDMTAFALVNVAPAARIGWLAGVAAGATGFALGLILIVALQRRAALAARLVIEARAKEELELTVADRTVELTAEVAERRATEQRLRDAQEELVQAAKLSALGRMAAGIAHEINQPLAAIRGFAENAAVFLERGRQDPARENLDRIAALTERAARIVRNLRAFARKEPEPATAVPLVAVVEDALSLLEARLRREDAIVTWRPPASSPIVVGGVVRLQQVVVNLIANALDAQVGVERPQVEIAVAVAEERARLTVHDRGAGLSAEARARLFEPFFTSKTGTGEGMGLGLSISYSIVKGFGGELRGENHVDGGALFTIELRIADPELAAA